jgi:hypothetical protein
MPNPGINFLFSHFINNGPGRIPIVVSLDVSKPVGYEESMNRIPYNGVSSRFH